MSHLDISQQLKISKLIWYMDQRVFLFYTFVLPVCSPEDRVSGVLSAYFLPTYQQILQRKVGRIQTSRQTPDSPLRRWLQNYINSKLCKGVNKKEAAICATVVMVWTTYIAWSNDWPQTFDRLLFEQGMVSVQFSFLLLTWSGWEVAGISEVKSKICRNVQAQEHIEDNILLILY